jgi:biotin synthase-like enzyme
MRASENTVLSLSKNRDLSDSELKSLIETDTLDELLFTEADRVRRENYGEDVYIRGLIEFTNYCKTTATTAASAETTKMSPATD